MKNLKDLPNESGFEFVGIKHDGSKVDCFVKFSFEGQYVVLSKHTNNRMWGELKGWVKS